MTEEYFQPNSQSNTDTNYNTNTKDSFVSLGTDEEQNQIAKTIAINCKEWKTNKNKIMANKPPDAETLDTPYYARYKPLEQHIDRKYYWNPHKLVEEGIRRIKDDEKVIANIQAAFDKETDPDLKQYLQDELNLYKWRKNILQLKDKDTGLDRDMRDITSDYYPAEIGLVRPWMEIHSHIPDYSY